AMRIVIWHLALPRNARRIDLPTVYQPPLTIQIPLHLPSRHERVPLDIESQRLGGPRAGVIDADTRPTHDANRLNHLGHGNIEFVAYQIVPIQSLVNSHRLT